MPLKLVFLKVGLSFKYKWTWNNLKVYIASCQKADSIVSVHTSKELELKGLKTTQWWLNIKNLQEWHKAKQMRRF